MTTLYDMPVEILFNIAKNIKDAKAFHCFISCFKNLRCFIRSYKNLNEKLKVSLVKLACKDVLNLFQEYNIVVLFMKFYLPYFWENTNLDYSRVKQLFYFLDRKERLHGYVFVETYSRLYTRIEFNHGMMINFAISRSKFGKNCSTKSIIYNILSDPTSTMILFELENENVFKAISGGIHILFDREYQQPSCISCTYPPFIYRCQSTKISGRKSPLIIKKKEKGRISYNKENIEINVKSTYRCGDVVESIDGRSFLRKKSELLYTPLQDVDVGFCNGVKYKDNKIKRCGKPIKGEEKRCCMHAYQIINYEEY